MLRFPKRKTTGIAIMLTPLIDMVFLLLIYFLLTSNFVEQEGITVSLPKVTVSGLYSEKAVLVVIDQAGRFYIDDRTVGDQEFANLLRAYISLSPDKSVVVKADKRVAYDRVTQALDIAKTSGALQLHLSVEKRPESSNKL
ncbi:MAG: hypothetical protein A2521_17250 [Deltaproteobacteria bacterium RIFOXYD12_FULL_57_12]|nr:MAG: hypothetical protein A2521_17250 [Deltaproteobacteria bacterium RIFOXYD12_FULL_57_12]